MSVRKERFAGVAVAVAALLGIFAWTGAGMVLRAASPAGAPPRDLGPAALAVAPDGKTLYAANADAHEVAVVMLPGGAVARRIAVAGPATGVAVTPDGARLVVTCAAPQSTVAVFDTASGRQTACVAVGHTAMGPAISPDGRRLYVCNRFDNDVSVIDLVSGKQQARVAVVREPIAAAVAPDGRTVLVANHLPLARTDDPLGGHVAAVVTALDAQTLRTESISLSHGAGCARGLCITPDGKYAIVTHLLSNFQKAPFRVDMGWINVNVISLIDIARRKVVRTIGMDEQDLGAGNPWDVVCADGGKAVCVSLSGTHEVCVIDMAALLSDPARRMAPMMGVWPIYPSLAASQWRRTALPGKGPRGMVALGTRVYVAQYFSDAIAVVDIRRDEPTPAGAAATETTPSGNALDRDDPPPSNAFGAAIGSVALGPAPQWTQQRRGEFLFCDATMCHQHWQSCASCHPDARTDSLNWDLMNDGAGNAKNTKSMLLSHQTPPAMAEGVRMSAEDAVRAGIRHILFVQRPEADAVAIDTYLKALRPVPSPHLVDGRLSPAARSGQKLFQSQRVGCSECHPAPLYADLRSHNVGSRGPTEATERFDTPTLLEVWRTAPYLHDGRHTTLRELLVDGKHGLRNGILTPGEIDELIAFVRSL